MSKLHKNATAALGHLKDKVSTLKDQQAVKNKEFDSNTDAYQSFFLHGAKTGMQTAGNMLTYHYLNVVNEILKVMSDELEKLGPASLKVDGLTGSIGDVIPSGQDIADAEEVQQGILNKLEKLANNPAFQEKWDKLARSMAELLNSVIGHVLDVVEEEGEDVINRLGKVAKKLLVNLAATGVDTVEDTLSVIPGLDAIVAVFILFTSAVTDGANSMMVALTMFNSFIQLSEKFMKVTLGADNKLLSIVEEVQSFIDMIESPGKEINDALDKVDARNKIPSLDDESSPSPSAPPLLSSDPTPSTEPSAKDTSPPIFRQYKTNLSTRKRQPSKGGNKKRTHKRRK